MIEAGTYTVWQLYRFYIRGKNPKNEDVVNYINSHVDAEFRDYAWMIAKHESRDEYTGTYYNQFNPSDRLTELPFKSGGRYYGWGIAQIDKGQSGSVTAEVYDWHENVKSMNRALREKLVEYRHFIWMYRVTYQNDPTTTWVEPDMSTINVDGYDVPAEMWGVMNCYNGKGGILQTTIGMFGNQKSPVKFNPLTSSWEFYINMNDYVQAVLQDRNKTGNE